jgi:cyclopropane fatty-acyl-phospholipid synthase-like methyltransferase
MKFVNNPDFNQKELVASGYDACAEAYGKVRISKEEPALELLLEKLKPKSKILDIGCGNGIPVTQKLALTHNVTGVDISTKQILFARKNVPHAEFIQSDIMQYDLEQASWDAIVSFYALFHLKKEEQEITLGRVVNALKPGGYLLLTLADHDEAAYTEDDFFGTTMFWENYSFGKYQTILTELGISILFSGHINHGYNEEYNGNEESHPIVFGQKIHSKL